MMKVLKALGHPRRRGIPANPPPPPPPSPPSNTSLSRAVRDYAWLHGDLHNLASQLSVPLSGVGTIVVPNLMPLPKSVVHRVCTKMVSRVAGPAWEKWALNHAIHITRSNPQTVRRVFDRAARQHDKQPTRPPCTCHLANDIPGTHIIIHGHLALIPIAIPFPDGSVARPNEPSPSPVIKFVNACSRTSPQWQPKSLLLFPPLHRLLPPSLWPESGTRLHCISNYAARIIKHFYVHIVDKGAGVLSAFCRHWVWGVLESFLQVKGYVELPLTPRAATEAIRNDLLCRGWEAARQLAILYLISKAKSISKGS